jgi:AhpD family alkylhydroperoxidase
MARIPAVPEEQAGVLGRLAYRYARRRFGAVPEPFAVLRHHPRLFWAGALAEAADEKAATVLPRRLRELAVYRAATVVGCSWCVDFGTMLQRLGGLDVERLQHIDDYADSPFFTPTERLAIAYADAMTAQPMAVTDDQVVALERELGRAGLIELTHVIAHENERARFNHALGITDQGFAEACRVSRG